MNRIQDMLESEGKGAVFQNMKPSMDIVILIMGQKNRFSAQIWKKKIAVSENCVMHLGVSSVRPFPLNWKTHGKKPKQRQMYFWDRNFLLQNYTGRVCPISA